MARASSGGNSSSSISISGWFRGTRIEALGFRLGMRGRPVLDLPRSGSPSEMDEDDDDKDEVCVRLLSLGSGIAGTGSAPCTAPESADMTIH